MRPRRCCPSARVGINYILLWKKSFCILILIWSSSSSEISIPNYLHSRMVDGLLGLFGIVDASWKVVLPRFGLRDVNLLSPIWMSGNMLDVWFKNYFYLPMLIPFDFVYVCPLCLIELAHPDEIWRRGILDPRLVFVLYFVSSLIFHLALIRLVDDGYCLTLKSCITLKLKTFFQGPALLRRLVGWIHSSSWLV